MTLTSGKTLLIALLACANLFAAGCGLNSRKDTVTECELPTDQAATLSGRWTTTPIPLAVQSGLFSSDDIREVKAAAETWNKFFDKSMKITVMEYGNSSTFRTSSATRPPIEDLCERRIIDAKGFNAAVVIYKNQVWEGTNGTNQPYAKIKNAIALTNLCPVNTQPVPTFQMAVIELNYKNFFVSGRKVPDLRSIITHELGHLIGLRHSCEEAGSKGMPDCDDAKLPSDYRTAVMFPQFGFNDNTGEVRRTLNRNDMSRSNCLYQDGADIKTE